MERPPFFRGFAVRERPSRDLVVSAALACLAVATVAAGAWLLADAARAQSYTHECPYKVTGLQADQKLNVRQGPGLHFRRIGRIAPGTNGLLVDKCNRGWCRIDHNGAKGWVKMTYMAAYCG